MHISAYSSFIESTIKKHTVVLRTAADDVPYISGTAVFCQFISYLDQD